MLCGSSTRVSSTGHVMHAYCFPHVSLALLRAPSSDREASGGASRTSRRAPSRLHGVRASCPPTNLVSGSRIWGFTGVCQPSSRAAPARKSALAAVRAGAANCRTFTFLSWPPRSRRPRGASSCSPLSSLFAHLRVSVDVYLSLPGSIGGGLGVAGGHAGLSRADSHPDFPS